LVAAVVGGEALEQRVRMWGVAHLERATADEVADAVEDDDAPCPTEGEVARERIPQLLRVREAARVQEVVAVEEVEVSRHGAVGAPRRGARPRPRTRSATRPARRAGSPRGRRRCAGRAGAGPSPR